MGQGNSLDVSSYNLITQNWKLIAPSLYQNSFTRQLAAQRILIYHSKEQLNLVEDRLMKRIRQSNPSVLRVFYYKNTTQFNSLCNCGEIYKLKVYVEHIQQTLEDFVSNYCKFNKEIINNKVVAILQTHLLYVIKAANYLKQKYGPFLLTQKNIWVQNIRKYPNTMNDNIQKLNKQAKNFNLKIKIWISPFQYSTLCNQIYTEQQMHRSLIRLIEKYQAFFLSKKQYLQILKNSMNLTDFFNKVEEIMKLKGRVFPQKQIKEAKQPNTANQNQRVYRCLNINDRIKEPLPQAMFIQATQDKVAKARKKTQSLIERKLQKNDAVGMQRKKATTLVSFSHSNNHKHVIHDYQRVQYLEKKCQNQKCFTLNGEDVLRDISDLQFRIQLPSDKQQISQKNQTDRTKFDSTNRQDSKIQTSVVNQSRNKININFLSFTSTPVPSSPVKLKQKADKQNNLQGKKQLRPALQKQLEKNQLPLNMVKERKESGGSIKTERSKPIRYFEKKSSSLIQKKNSSSQENVQLPQKENIEIKISDPSQKSSQSFREQQCRKDVEFFRDTLQRVSQKQSQADNSVKQQNKLGDRLTVSKKSSALNDQSLRSSQKLEWEDIQQISRQSSQNQNLQKEVYKVKINMQKSKKWRPYTKRRTTEDPIKMDHIIQKVSSSEQFTVQKNQQKKSPCFEVNLQQKQIMAHVQKKPQLSSLSSLQQESVSQNSTKKERIQKSKLLKNEFTQFLKIEQSPIQEKKQTQIKSLTEQIVPKAISVWQDSKSNSNMHSALCSKEQSKQIQINFPTYDTNMMPTIPVNYQKYKSTPRFIKQKYEKLPTPKSVNMTANKPEHKGQVFSEMEDGSQSIIVLPKSQKDQKKEVLQQKKEEIRRQMQNLMMLRLTLSGHQDKSIKQKVNNKRKQFAELKNQMNNLLL